MNRVGEFEKVSYQAFFTAIKDAFGEQITDEADIQSAYDSLELPTRATSGSAGYDFHLPFPVTLASGMSVKIPTGIRVKIEDGWWLACLPRSSLGFKYRLQLDNTCGVIDADYYYADNEGHIFAKLTNDSRDPYDGRGGKRYGKTLSLKQGDRFMQGIFLPYGITCSDEATSARSGGMGSTGV